MTNPEPDAKPPRGPVSISLFGQLFALVLLSIITAQLVNLWIVFQSPPSPPDFYRLSEVVAALKSDGLTPTRNGQPLKHHIQKSVGGAREPDRLERYVAGELSRRLNAKPEDIRITMTLDRRSSARQTVRVVRQLMGVRGIPRGEDGFIVGSFEVDIRQPDGAWLVVEPQQHGLLNRWQAGILLWFTITACGLAPLAYLFARRLSAPITAFAQAADRLGKDPNAPPLKMQGPADLRAMIGAFNEMQGRLRRYVQDRTAMIGAVAHDLRTPLTRLRFRVEHVPEPLRSKMTADMEQMDAMIAATMAFVRDASQTGERRRLELSSLVHSIADEMADTGADVAAEAAGPVVISGDPIALRRLIANLLDNAVKFGERARARVYSQDNSAVIEVDDDGPGLATIDKDRVFEPFYRGEPSRSRETGGAGLGLAVVRSVARAHGGDATLENLPGGGLRARAFLPI